MVKRRAPGLSWVRVLAGRSTRPYPSSQILQRHAPSPISSVDGTRSALLAAVRGTHGHLRNVRRHDTLENQLGHSVPFRHCRIESASSQRKDERTLVVLVAQVKKQDVHLPPVVRIDHARARVNHEL